VVVVVVVVVCVCVCVCVFVKTAGLLYPLTLMMSWLTLRLLVLIWLLLRLEYVIVSSTS